jgi:hypothetical protein
MPSPSDDMTRRHSRKQRLTRLRDLMVNACDLTEPIDYFLEQLANDPVFVCRSVPGEPAFDPILRTIADHLLGPGAPGNWNFLRHGALWHGGCPVGERVALALYHERLDIGILAIPVDGARMLIRFTVLSWKITPRPEQAPN